MDPSDMFMSNANGQYDNDGFVKQTPTQTNGADHHVEEEQAFVFGKSPNGTHRNDLMDYSDMDFGPETDVDALDDSRDFGNLQNVSRELFPDGDTADDEVSNKVADSQPASSPTETRPQNALTADTENVGDSEDSDDEWNYYKVDPNKEKDTKTSTEVEELIKIEDKPKEEIPESKLDIFETEKQDEDSSSDSEAPSEKEVCSLELIDTKISNEACEESKNLQDLQDNFDNMDFQLNPNAAEFIPVSPSPRMPRLVDIPIAGSPLKQTPTMDDFRLPSPKEFQEGASHRPHEVEDVDDTIASPNGSFLEGDTMKGISDEFSDKPKMGFGMDVSEISSTRAEFGDESTASFATNCTTDLHKTGGLDGSYTESFVYDDPMIMSFGPGSNAPIDLNAVHDLSDVNVGDFNGSPIAEDEKGEEEAEAEAEREVPSPDYHPELANLISPESDYPQPTDAFPDHQDTEMLQSSSPVPECTAKETQLFEEKIEAITQEVAAMNLKNEQLSEQSHVEEKEEKEEEATEKAESHLENLTSHCLTPAFNVDCCPSPEISSTTSEQCEVTAEITSPKPEETFDEPMDEEIHSEAQDHNNAPQSIAPDVGVFQNPLNPDFMMVPEPQNEIVAPEPAEEDQIRFEVDDEPVSAELDPPTGDPCSRSLSPAPAMQDEEENHPEPSAPEEIQEDVPVVEPTVSMKLSESLQEFTGLEKQLSPLANGDATKDEIVKECTIEVSQQIVDKIPAEPQIVEPEPEKEVESVSPALPIIETPEDSSKVEAVAVAAGAVAVAAAASTLAAPSKPKTPKVTSKTPSKPTPKSTLKSSPTSPTKASGTLTSRSPAVSSATKKTPVAAGTRTKVPEVASKASTMQNKSPAAKTTAPSKPTASSTARAPLTAKAKPAATKLSSTVTEKKVSSATTNGEAKSSTAKLPAKPKTSTISSTTAAKPLVKSTTTSRPTTAPAAKPKTLLGSVTSKAPAKPASTTIGAAARPKTAPSTLGVTKSRVTTSAKSPVLDKQIKETANKQISSNRTSTTTTVTKTSRTGVSSSTTTSATATKRASGATAPAKKLPLTSTTRMAAKSTTAVSKVSVKTNGTKAKLQNGVCEVKSKVIAEAISNVETMTITTTTVTNGEDVIQKDVSPVVEVTTDNQLIITAD